MAINKIELSNGSVVEVGESGGGIQLYKHTVQTTYGDTLIIYSLDSNQFISTSDINIENVIGVNIVKDGYPANAFLTKTSKQSYYGYLMSDRTIWNSDFAGIASDNVTPL